MPGAQGQAQPVRQEHACSKAMLHVHGACAHLLLMMAVPEGRRQAHT